MNNKRSRRNVAKAVRKPVGRNPRTRKISAVRNGARRAAKVSRGAKGLMLSECAAKYLLASTNAAHPGARGACVPTYPVMNSQKTMGLVRGTFNVGTLGFGYISVAPCVTSDQSSIFFSDSSYASTVTQSNTSAVGVVDVPIPNNPYTTAVVNSGAASTRATGRIVGGELRVRYTGTLLNRGGMIYGLTDPDHAGVDGYTTATLASRDTVRAIVDTGDWVSISVCAIRPNETEYAESTVAAAFRSFPFSDTTASNPNTSGIPIMCFVVTGVPGNSFQFEWIQHNEYVGAPTSGRTTPNMSDATGFQNVNAAILASQSDTQEASSYDATISALYRNRDAMARAMVDVGAYAYNMYAPGRQQRSRLALM